MSNFYVRDVDIRDLCEIKTNYQYESIDCFAKSTNSGSIIIKDRMIYGVLKSNEYFPKLNGDAGYSDPLDHKLLVSGVYQEFVPKYGLNSERRIEYNINYSINRIYTKYLLNSSGVPVYSLNIDYTYGGRKSTRTINNIRSYIIAICGGGASGTYCSAYGAGGENGGAGSGASTIAIRIVPTHTNVDGNDDINSIVIGEGGKIDNQFGKYAIWASGGGGGHDGSDSVITINNYRFCANGGSRSGGKGGTDGPWPTFYRDSTDISTDAWTVGSGKYEVSSYSLKYFDGNGCKFQIVGVSRGGRGSNGGGGAGAGDSANINIRLNSIINTESISFKHSGGPGWDGGWAAAPGGGGASAFGVGGGCSGASGLTFHMQRSSYGGGGGSGILAQFPILFGPGTAFNPGSGGDGLLVVIY